MNDRFLFRAWSKKENKMFQVMVVEAFADGSFYHKNEHLKVGLLDNIEGQSKLAPDVIRFVPYSEVELMQCTGLKDKNGKLIYEGDIVKNEDSVLAITEPKRTGCGCHDGWGYSLPNDEDESPFEGYEIIGNIYESPELLATSYPVVQLPENKAKEFLEKVKSIKMNMCKCDHPDLHHDTQCASCGCQKFIGELV